MPSYTTASWPNATLEFPTHPPTDIPLHHPSRTSHHTSPLPHISPQGRDPRAPDYHTLMANHNSQTFLTSPLPHISPPLSSFTPHHPQGHDPRAPGYHTLMAEVLTEAERCIHKRSRRLALLWELGPLVESMGLATARHLSRYENKMWRGGGHWWGSCCNAASGLQSVSTSHPCLSLFLHCNFSTPPPHPLPALHTC